MKYFIAKIGPLRVKREVGGTPYMKTALQVCDLEKSFKKHLFSKKRTILQGLSFSLIKGEVTGFLGPNGSGKTTALKCILGLMPYDKGKVLFFPRPRVGGDKGCGQILPRGHDRRTGPQTVTRFAGLLSREILSRVGFLPEEPCFYDYLTAEELLIFYGRLSSNLKKPDLKIKVRKWLKKLGIEGAKDQKIKTFSKGMLRKVGLAQALMFEPELLILDEPLAGLDPDSRKQVCQIIKDHAKLLGGAVFFSSHLIDDVQKTCDKIVTLPKTPLNPQEP